MTTAPPSSHYPKCGTVPNLYKHGKKQQLFFDLPMHAKRVGLFIKRERYKCLEGNEKFFETLSDMDVKRSVTNRHLINSQIGGKLAMNGCMKKSMMLNFPH